MPPFNNSDLYDPSRGWKIWNWNEIVHSAGEVDRYVPNPDDLVWHVDNGWYVVRDVEQGTHISTLDRWHPPAEADTDGDENVLVGVGPGYSSESYRIFLDTSVTPHILAPDVRLHFYGSQVASYKVFKGSDISEETGLVISEFFNAGGDYLGPNVPVESVEVNVVNGFNRIIKSCMVGFTSHQMDDGERVTLVAEGTNGNRLSIAQLLVINSRAVRQADQHKKYVSGIKVDSPFLSKSDPKIIEFPLNVTVQSLPMTGVVEYRGGGDLKLGLDGVNMSLYGLEDYIATEVGQEFPLTLAYTLADDEISYGVLPSADRRLTSSYIARTTPIDGAYECRLFVYPYWVNAAVGYRLEFWLYNLDRQRHYNVTGLVELGVTSPAFDPKRYGSLQTLTYAINLNDVDGRYNPYRHVSTFQITLISEGSNRNANWEVFSRANVDVAYGRGLKGDLEHLQVNKWDLRLANGATTREMWLRQMYEAAAPLTNPDMEIHAPEPTHFIVHLLHNKYEFSVADWNKKLRVNNDMLDGQLLYISWIRRTYNEDLQLAMTAVPILIR